MQVFNESMEQFIENYAKVDNVCRDYKSYPQAIQNLLEGIYIACSRFLLRKAQILYILDETLKCFKDIYSQYKELSKLGNQKKILIKEIEELINIKANISINTKPEVIIKQQELNITEIAKYLNVSRQTIYNMKKNHKKS